MKSSYSKLAFVLLTVIAPAVHAQAVTAPIRWHIENPFRLFRDPADFERLRIPANTTVNEWFSTIAHRIDDGILPYRRTHWDPAGGLNRSGQYSPGYIFPKSHRIVLSWAGAKEGARCDWTIGGRPQLNTSCTSITADVPYNYHKNDGPPIDVSVAIRGEPSATARTTMKVIDRLVIAIGDSFTAGQGAPDRPSRLSFTDSYLYPDPFEPCTDERACVWFPKLNTGQPAEWWDNECNRSLLSWPALAALKLASNYSDSAQQSEDESARVQYAVTFASYACSGAEFYDGIFMRQRNPPGEAKDLPDPRDGAAGTAGVQRSQLQAVGVDLCDLPNGEVKIGQGWRRIEAYTCHQPRKADLVLMSIGGNDAGFAKVIMNGLLPQPWQGNSNAGRVALTLTHKALGTVDVAEAEARRKRMLPGYALLDSQLAPYMDPRSAVFVMAYPNPLRRPSHFEPQGACGVEMRAGMEAARAIGYPLVKSWWHFWFDQKEAQQTIDRVITPLQEEVGTAVAALQRWKYVTSHLAEFEQHGLCADAEETEQGGTFTQPTQALKANVRRYGLPRQRWFGGSPEHLSLDDWRAYDTQLKRWIRTPNDAVRTQTARTLEASMAGAFHPTGAGYAAMAEAAAKKVQTHLKSIEDEERKKFGSPAR